MQSVADEISGYLEGRRDSMLERLEAAVLAESPTLVPESQQAVFELFRGWFDEIGYQCLLLGGKSSGGQLFARPIERKRCGYQVLLGHSDTVWPIGSLEEMPFVVDNGQVHGPGVYDMKAGLIQALFALKALHDLEIATPLTPVFFMNSDEETGSRDSRNRIRWLARGARRVFILEPGTGREGHLKTARKGTGQFRIRIRGRAAHAGVEPEAGASAIIELAHLIHRLDAINDYERGITVNVGTIDGGLRPNVVAPTSEAVVDVRVPTIELAREIEQQILSLKPHNPEVEVTITGKVGRAPLERTPRNRILWRQAQAAARLLGLEIEESTSGGGSDGNITSLYTATIDGVGAVGGGAHAPHEFVYIDRLVDRSALLALMLAAPDEVTDA